MSAKRKTVFKGFDYMHCDDFANYLSDMALKGWHFKEWSVGLKFEKGEPEQAVYAVEVFPNASENDMRPGPHTEEFVEYCEKAGWKFIDAKQKYCIFKKLEKDAVDLFTQEERLNNAFKGSVSGSAWLLLFLYGLNAVLQSLRLFYSFETTIFSGEFFFGLTIWSVLSFEQAGKILYAFWKRKRLRNDIRSGNRVYLGNPQKGKVYLSGNEINAGILIFLLLFYLVSVRRIEFITICVISIIVTLAFIILLNKIRPAGDINLLLQIGFSVLLFIIILGTVYWIMAGEKDIKEQDQNLPLQSRDYRETDDSIHSIRRQKDQTFFGKVDRYMIQGEKEAIYYNVYQSSSEAILDKVWESLVESKAYNESAVNCKEDWDAQKAVRNIIGIYYVRYDDAILEFSDSADAYLSKKQIAIIKEKLGLGR